MIRKIIQIDEDACTGCGQCVHACHEGAIGMVGGKARLLRDDYCDALGDCLPACPVDAIHFVEREAAAYDAEAVEQRKLDADAALVEGEMLLDIAAQDARHPKEEITVVELRSGLAQWPCQIKLMPIKAPYYDGADLLVAADCTAFACPGFSQRFMDGHVTIIGCPKLDGVDYADKLAEILCANDVNSVTVARMEVPCCGGLQSAVERAVNMSARRVPVSVITIATDGRVLSQEQA